MTAVDTNILIDAHRMDSPHHAEAAEFVRSIAEGGEPWAIPWPCVHEFISIATHPKVFDPPSTRDEVFDQLSAWFESPTVRLIGEQLDHLSALYRVSSNLRSVGPKIHDARIMAICELNGVTRLATRDRDFHEFKTTVEVWSPMKA